MAAIFNTIFNFQGSKGSDWFTSDTIIFIDPINLQIDTRIFVKRAVKVTKLQLSQCFFINLNYK